MAQSAADQRQFPPGREPIARPQPRDISRRQTVPLRQRPCGRYGSTRRLRLLAWHYALFTVAEHGRGFAYALDQKLKFRWLRGQPVIAEFGVVLRYGEVLLDHSGAKGDRQQASINSKRMIGIAHKVAERREGLKSP